MKIVIPAILAAAILVAGFIAFMPVQRAQTVHTFLANLINSNTNTQVTSAQTAIIAELADKPTIVCDSVGPVDVNFGVSQIRVTADSEFKLNDLYIFFNPGDGDEDLVFPTLQITADGITYGLTTNRNPAVGAFSMDFLRSSTATGTTFDGALVDLTGTRLDITIGSSAGTNDADDFMTVTGCAWVAQADAASFNVNIV